MVVSNIVSFCNTVGLHQYDWLLSSAAHLSTERWLKNLHNQRSNKPCEWRLGWKHSLKKISSTRKWCICHFHTTFQSSWRQTANQKPCHRHGTCQLVKEIWSVSVKWRRISVRKQPPPPKKNNKKQKKTKQSNTRLPKWISVSHSFAECCSVTSWIIVLVWKKIAS